MKQELNVKRKVNSRESGSRERAIENVGVRRRKRRIRKYTIYYLLIIIIVLSAMVVLSMTVFFNINSIVATETEVYSAEKVIEASGVHTGENMIRLNAAEVEEKILKELVYIDDVEVKRRLPNTLSIEYTAAEITYNYNLNGAYSYISQSGRILESGEAEPYPGVLTILGLDIEKADIGQFIGEDMGKMERLESIRNNLENNSYEYADITSIDISSDTSTYITYQDRLKIVIELSNDEEYVIRAAKALIDQSIGITEKGEIFFVESTQQIHFVAEKQ